MAKRWSSEDIRELKSLAQSYSVQAIAEKMDRSVGAWPSRRINLACRSRRARKSTNDRARDFE